MLLEQLRSGLAEVLHIGARGVERREQRLCPFAHRCFDQNLIVSVTSCLAERSGRHWPDRVRRRLLHQDGVVSDQQEVPRTAGIGH